MSARAKSDESETWDGLAGLLQIPVRRIHEFRKRNGSPETKSLSDWEDFIEEHTGSGDESSAEASGIDLLIKGETHRKLKIKNDRDEGTLVAEARQVAQEILVAEGKRLRSILVGLLPARLGKSCAGKSAAEIGALARPLIEAALLEAKRDTKR